MPMWHTNMTAEDYERNKREWIEEKRREAKELRARARRLLDRANEIDPDKIGLAPTKDDPNLLEQLLSAYGRGLSEKEKRAQRESWVRANMPTGDPRFD